MVKRKGRKAARKPQFLTPGKRSSTAAPKESQIEPPRSSTPPRPEPSPGSRSASPPSPPREPSPKSRSASPPSCPSDGDGTKIPSMAAKDDTWEKVVNSGKTEDLKNATESKKQKAEDEKIESFEMGASVPNDSPLPLIRITRLLKGIAQFPHFRGSLQDYSGIVREQLESAWDQAFIDTASRIQGLRSKDFWVNSIELWNAAADLQTMGYDLIPLRRRLFEVRDVILAKEQTKLKILALEEKAEKHTQEKIRLQKKIVALKEKLEEKMTNVQFALKKAEQIEYELPKYNVLMSELAKKPFWSLSLITGDNES